MSFLKADKINAINHNLFFHAVTLLNKSPDNNKNVVLGSYFTEGTYSANCTSNCKMYTLYLFIVVQSETGNRESC